METKNKVLLSIITPCYNSGNDIVNYLQELSDIECSNLLEFVIVDDCSTDNSYQTICDYKEKSRLNMVLLKTNVNSGPGEARNIGIMKSSGKYITFLDSDDKFSDMFFCNIIKELDKGMDLYIFNYEFIDSKSVSQKNMLTSADMIHDNIEDILVYCRGCPWGKIYKASIIFEHNIRFLKQMRAEDIPFTKVAISFCQTFSFIDKPYYKYIQHNGSLMHRTELLDSSNASNAYYYIRDNLCDKFDYSVREALYIKEYLYSTSLTNAKSLCKKQWKQYVTSISEDFPNPMRNKYLKRFPLMFRIIVFLIVKKQYGIIKFITSII